MKPFLILDYSLEHPEVLGPILYHLNRVGYVPEYRRYYPKLVRSDLEAYAGIGILMAKESEVDGYMTTADQKELLVEFVKGGKLLVIFTTRPTSLESDHEAITSNDVSFFNSILNELGINIQINFDQIYDEVNNYAASLVQPPFYRTLKGHPINPKGYEQLTLGRCCSLSVGSVGSGAEADVLLLTYPTARNRSTSGEIPVAATARGCANNSNNLGHVFLIGKQIFTESGSLSFSRPLLRIDRIKESCDFLKRLSEHIKEKAELKTDEEMRRWGDEEKKIEALSPHRLIPSSVFNSALRLPPSKGGYIFGVQRRSSIPAVRLKRQQSWRNRVDKNIYGWIEAEKIRAGWCYINSGDGSYRKSLIDVCKHAKLNLLWGVADSDMTSKGKIEVTPDMIKQWDEITEELDPQIQNSKSQIPNPKVRWFMGVQYPHMTVDRNSYPHTVALNGKNYQAPSPVDIDYWKSNIIPSVKAFAKYSLSHPSVGGVMMDLEMYGFPFLFYSDIHDYSDLAFDLFLKSESERQKAELKTEGAKGRREEGETKIKSFSPIRPFAHSSTRSLISTSLTLSAAERKEAEGLSPSRRFDWLMKRGYLEQYHKVLSWRAEEIGRLYREEIHKINPNLILGFYTGNIMMSWFYLAFWRGASSKTRPIILLTFNTESARNLAIMKREGIYMYHASAALMGKFLISDFEEVILNAAKNGDGYWLNRLTALVTEKAHYGEIEAPHDLDKNGNWKALHKKEEKYKAIEAIRRANERIF